MKNKIRIASGQGFWGDLPNAPEDQVSRGPIDYMMMDYLAEVTMSILQKQKRKDPTLGYARDLVPLMRKLLPDPPGQRDQGRHQWGWSELPCMPRRDL